MTKIKLALLIICVFTLSHCKTVVLDIPEGFAYFSKNKSYFKMISSDGVTIKAYIPEQSYDEENVDAELWVNEMEIIFKSKSYTKLKKENIMTQSGLKGIYSEYSLFHNGEIYIYSITVLTDKEKLFVIESGGQKKYFEKRKETILKGIKSFRLEISMISFID